MKLRNKKTGEIIEYDEEVIYYRKLTPNGHEDWTPYHPEDWEDYEPAEPLIKDEKIRKAVRAWAEANNSTKMVFDGYHLASDEHGNDIEFSNSWAENVKHGEWYTIAELCGEEEKCL